MLSIVIPAYNEEKLLPVTLESLVKQKTSYTFEVIVVDNNSTDKTSEVAKKFGSKLNIKVIKEKKKGRGAARQIGFIEAKGEIILSTDADTTLPSDWVERLVTELKKSKVDAVTGTCTINDCDPLTNWCFNLFQPLSMKGYCLVYGHYWLSGFNFAIYKKSYLKTAGFDSNLNGLEDIDLSFKLMKAGTIKFIPDLPVEFSGRRLKFGIIPGFFQYIKSFVDYHYLKRKNVILSDVRS